MSIIYHIFIQYKKKYYTMQTYLQLFTIQNHDNYKLDGGVSKSLNSSSTSSLNTSSSSVVAPPNLGLLDGFSRCCLVMASVFLRFLILLSIAASRSIVLYTYYFVEVFLLAFDRLYFVIRQHYESFKLKCGSSVFVIIAVVLHVKC